MSQGPNDENPRIEQEAREAERRLGALGDRSEDALTDEEARVSDIDRTEQDAD
ncbi:hypothetical protein GA0070607_0696 [Micromonospora coriariae]|uniref:Uncharacterized protein n=1 Tax=Micromonospora coriariae TaxID=285665 RepID=A0A1C4UIR1_9ACTN|nr:hypothetical protein [Micromonospora coriariae]SCE71583.1 hypothetical protein GA0070607_0696 [Micromonospora coriariae]